MDGLMIGGELPAHLVQDSTNRQRMEGKALVRFYWRTVPDSEKSAAEGRPVHKSAAYIMIRVPGDKTNEIDAPVTERHKKRFPKAWADFISQNEVKVSGTPLEAWTQLSAPEVADFKAQKIHTVEELSAVGDAHLNALGHNGRKIRDAARVYLEHARGLAPLARLQEENAAKDERISALEKQLADLQAAVQARETEPARRGPGRPPKSPQAGEE